MNLSGSQGLVGTIGGGKDFAVDYITNTDPITMLSSRKYRLFYHSTIHRIAGTPVAKKAFERYSSAGLAAGLGFHHGHAAG